MLLVRRGYAVLVVTLAIAAGIIAVPSPVSGAPTPAVGQRVFADDQGQEAPGIPLPGGVIAPSDGQPLRPETVWASADPPWLADVNSLRALAGLPAVTENTTFSAGDLLHAKYMAKNNILTHPEDSTKPFFTADGNAAGVNGNTATSGSLNFPDTAFVDLWMTAPFHGVGILDPKLQTTGFGVFREDEGPNDTVRSAATLDVIRGRAANVPAGVTFPVFFPGNGSTIPFTY